MEVPPATVSGSIFIYKKSLPPAIRGERKNNDVEKTI